MSPSTGLRTRRTAGPRLVGHDALRALLPFALFMLIPIWIPLVGSNSFPATASLLNVHKNTVRYRIEKAVQARGRPLDEDRLDLELALIACEWLGDIVLTR